MTSQSMAKKFNARRYIGLILAQRRKDAKETPRYA